MGEQTNDSDMTLPSLESVAAMSKADRGGMDPEGYLNYLRMTPEGHRTVPPFVAALGGNPASAALNLWWAFPPE